MRYKKQCYMQNNNEQMIIRELISGLKAGWHSGRGHKATRHKEYEKALLHYELALKYEREEGKIGSGPNPATLECLARTQARLGNYKEALLTAEKSYELYRQFTSPGQVVISSIARVEQFITALKTE